MIALPLALLLELKPELDLTPRGRGMDKSRYKRLAQLYTVGRELELADGIVLWMQALNSFEMDECRSAAQVARARMTLALNQEGSDELAKMQAEIEREGREATIMVLAAARQGEWMLKATEEIVADPEWTERMSLLERADDEDLPEMSESEKEALAKINTEYWEELQERMAAEEKAEMRRLEALSIEELREEYLDMWVDRRGGEAAMAVYRTNEAYYAARACEGVRAEDGSWDHSGCNEHRERAFDSVAEMRELPDDLQDLLVEAMNELNMSVREAKDSGSETDSSDSSLQPNEQEDSPVSTPADEPSTPPGTSTPQ